MMPVEDGNTLFEEIRKYSASFPQVSWQARMPAAPVAQLAFPELTSTASMRPRAFFRLARPTSTGAATTRLRVKTAAAVAPSEHAKARSGRPLALMPAAIAANENPFGTSMGSGERRSVFIPKVSRDGSPAGLGSMWWALPRAPSRPHRSYSTEGNCSSLCTFCRESAHGARV